MAINSDRVSALQQLGYTPREAAFLALAALQSGAFVARHFCDYCGTTAGPNRDAFTSKLTKFGHVLPLPTLNRTILYQIRKPVFVRLGEPDNKNRRAPADLLTRRRIMALDYVIANPDRQYLPTETDKLAYFTKDLGIAETLLPRRMYQPTSGNGAPTSRYFIEKFPVSAIPGGAALCYVDGDGSMQSFATFLRGYRPILATLPEAELVFVTRHPTIWLAAESCFEKLRKADEDTKKLDGLELQFRERRELESIGLAALAPVQLRRLRDLRGMPRGEFYDRWLNGGFDDLKQDALVRSRATSLHRVRFSLSVLRCDYAFLGCA
ncbi:MAG: hypothetical protein M3Z85_19540 [Acidobacteriota bacterium]|nr:hypothetical protein [Acidobacteriota bacterium]